MEKIKNVEILRLLLALVVVLLHLKVNEISHVPFFEQLFTNCQYGWYAVDFFFIISGFFMFLTTKFEQSFQAFSIKKLIRFMPTVCATLLIMFVVSLFIPIGFLKYENLFTILNIQNIGITYSNGNLGPAWFLSSMFWSMCFYFYLYKIVDKKVFNLITAFVILFSYAMFTHGTGRHYDNIAYVFNVGTLRALGGIGIGYFLSMLYKDNIQKIREKKLKVWQTLIVTSFELLLFFFIFSHLAFHKTNYNNLKMFMILTDIGLFSLFVIRKGYLSKLFENNLSVFLGKFAFAIFVTHVLIIKLWKYYFIQHNLNITTHHPILSIIFVFIAVIIFGILTHYFVEKPCTNYLKNKIKL